MTDLDNQKSSGKLLFFTVILYTSFVLLRPHEYVAVLKGLPILPVLMLLSMMAWLFLGRKGFNTSQNKLIIAFLFVVSLSPILQGWVGGITVAFTKFFPTVMLYLLLVGSLDNNVRLRKFLWLMSLSAFIMSLHGIFQDQYGVGWTGMYPVMDGRITYIGIFNDPNDLGNLFVSTLPMILFLMGYHKSQLIKLLLRVVFITVIYGVYLTASRGAFLGIAGIIWFYFARKYGYFRAIIFSMLMLPVFLLGPSRIAEIDPNEESAHGRVDAWYAGLEMLINSRFLGVGYGGFLDNHNLTAHNSFVLVFSELGLFGYFLWLAFVYLTFLMAYRMYERAMKKNTEERSDDEKISVSIFYSLIGYFVTAFFLSRSYNVLLYLLSALSVSSYLNINKNVEITLKGNYAKIMLLTFGSILFFFVLVKVLLNI